MVRFELPENLDNETIEHIYYIEKNFNEISKMTNEKLINIKDKILLWENKKL